MNARARAPFTDRPEEKVGVSTLALSLRGVFQWPPTLARITVPAESVQELSSVRSKTLPSPPFVAILPRDSLLQTSRHASGIPREPIFPVFTFALKNRTVRAARFDRA